MRNLVCSGTHSQKEQKGVPGEFSHLRSYLKRKERVCIINEGDKTKLLGWMEFSKLLKIGYFQKTI